MSITVNAVRDVKGKPVILATTTHQLVVKKKQEEKKPADKKTTREQPAARLPRAGRSSHRAANRPVHGRSSR